MADDRDDAYSRVARRYDRFIGPLVRRLRGIGLELYPPRPGTAVLDVGCGTGAQLAAYQQAGCHVSCVDPSSAMLSVARRRLGDEADIQEGDATALPYEDGTFDLATISFVLHELPSVDRAAIMGEMRRVLKPEGRILVVDFLPGPYRGLKALLVRFGIVAIEFAAGRDHWRNHRDFLARGALAALADAQHLSVREQRVAGGGTIGVSLLAARRVS
ncbi:demethylmenaquinone methyltransferase [bacterium BMS3Abin02]|nr:demethylmenaquinone methyltransferase [bacterium BMS3Abin02]GBE22800.1 demethylmenaquinone methyltransferase [bacterium BMS3Bbin01]